MEEANENGRFDDSDAVALEEYDAFISYKHVEPDAQVARWLQESLESFRVPRELVREQGYPERLRPVFRDESDLPAAASLPRKLKEELQNSRFLIVLCSPRVVDSNWVNNEIREFRALGREDRILAVLIEGEPPEVFPKALREVEAESSSGSYDEPLAADIRPRPGLSQRKIRRAAILRLGATIIGCDYDDLVRRAKERDARIRNRMLLSAAAILALIISATLFGLYQKSQAKNFKLSRDLRTQELRVQTLLTKQAEAARKMNLALAHYARGVEAESDNDLPAAKLHFAKSLSVFETPEARKKLADTWFTARRLWDIDLPSRVGAPPNDRARRMTCVRFGHDGKHVFVGTAEGEVWSLDRDTGELQSILRVGADVLKLAVHPHDNRLAVGGKDGSLSVVDPETGKLQLQTRFSGPITAIAFSGDGNALSVGLGSGGMRVIDAEDGEPWFVSPAGFHEVEVDSVSFAPAGGEMIWSMGRWLYTTDVATGRLTLVTPQDDSIMATAWGRGADPLLAWAGLDGPIQLLRRHDDVAEGRAQILAGQKRQKPAIRELPGHRGGGISALAFLPDGDTLVSAGYDGDVRLWNARTGKLLLVLEGHKGAVIDLALSAGGEYMATVGADNRVRVWRLPSERRAEVWSASQLSKLDPYQVGLGSYDVDELMGAADGALLIGLRNGTIRRWTPGRTKADLLAIDTKTMERQNTWFVKPDRTRLGVVTPDLGEQLTILSGKPRVTIYDLPALKKTTELAVDGLVSAAWFKDDMIVTGNKKGQVQLWDLARSKVLKSLGSRVSPIVAVATSSTANRIAALWTDGYVTVWEASRFGQILSRRVSEHPVNYFSLSPNGNTFVVSTRGAIGQTALWDVATQKVLFEGNQWTRSMAFSPDSRTLALGSDTEGEIWVVETATGAALATLGGSMRRVRALAFDESGATLYSAGDEQEVRAWSLADLDNLRRRAGTDLLDEATKTTGLTLVGLEHGPSPAASGISSWLKVDKKIVPIKPTRLDDFISEVSERIRPLFFAEDDQSGGGDKDTLQQAEREVGALLQRGSELSKQGVTDIRLVRLRATLQVLLADALRALSKTDEALAVYADAVTNARHGFERHENRIWPMLLKSHDRYAEALRTAEKPSEAFAVERDRIRLHQRLIEKGAALAPPLVEMWTHFGMAVKPLSAAERADKGLKLAQETTAFLRRRVGSTAEDPELLQGVAMFCETAAVLAAEAGRLAEARDALVDAEQYRGNAVRFYAMRSDPRQGNARAEWAATLANLAGATYYAAINAYEQPAGEQPSRETTLASVRKAGDLAERALAQYKIMAEDQELSEGTLKSVSTLRETQLLIQQSIEELEKEPPQNPK
jgi:WD40 repeat protein